MSDINYLHNSIGRVEWSGVLFYSILEGDISDPKSLVLRAERIFPLNKGTMSYTEYEIGPEIFNFYDGVEGSDDMRVGHVHTHHTMGTFFSGTDQSELHSNADKHVFYLSLIVNFEMKPTAKIAYITREEIKSKTFHKNLSGNWVFGEEEAEFECINEVGIDIEFEQDDWFITQMKEITKYVPPVYNYGNNWKGTGHTPGFHGSKGVGKTAEKLQVVYGQNFQPKSEVVKKLNAAKKTNLVDSAPTSTGVGNSGKVTEIDVSIRDFTGRTSEFEVDEELEFSQKDINDFVMRLFSLNLKPNFEFTVEAYLNQLSKELDDAGQNSLIEKAFGEHFHKTIEYSFATTTLDDADYHALFEEIQELCSAICTESEFAFKVYAFLQDDINLTSIIKSVKK